MECASENGRTGMTTPTTADTMPINHTHTIGTDQQANIQTHHHGTGIDKAAAVIVNPLAFSSPTHHHRLSSNPSPNHSYSNLTNSNTNEIEPSTHHAVTHDPNQLVYQHTPDRVHHSHSNSNSSSQSHSRLPSDSLTISSAGPSSVSSSLSSTPPTASSVPAPVVEYRSPSPQVHVWRDTSASPVPATPPLQQQQPQQQQATTPVSNGKASSNLSGTKASKLSNRVKSGTKAPPPLLVPVNATSPLRQLTPSQQQPPQLQSSQSYTHLRGSNEVGSTSSSSSNVLSLPHQANYVTSHSNSSGQANNLSSHLPLVHVHPHAHLHLHPSTAFSSQSSTPISSSTVSPLGHSSSTPSLFSSPLSRSPSSGMFPQLGTPNRGLTHHVPLVLSAASKIAQKQSLPSRAGGSAFDGSMFKHRMSISNNGPFNSSHPHAHAHVYRDSMPSHSRTPPPSLPLTLTSQVSRPLFSSASHDVTARVTREHDSDQPLQQRKTASVPTSIVASKIHTPMMLRSPANGTPRVARIDEGNTNNPPIVPQLIARPSFMQHSSLIPTSPPQQQQQPSMNTYTDEPDEPDALTPSTTVQPASAAHCILTSLPLYVSAKKRRSYAQHITYCESGGLVKDNTIGAVSVNVAPKSSQTDPLHWGGEDHSLIDTTRGWTFQPQRHTQVFKSHFQKKSHQAIFGLFTGYAPTKMAAPKKLLEANNRQIIDVEIDEGAEDLSTLATPIPDTSDTVSTAVDHIPADRGVFYAQFFRRYFLAFLDAYFPNLAASVPNVDVDLKLSLVDDLKAIMDRMVPIMKEEANKLYPLEEAHGSGCAWSIALIANGTLYNYSSSFTHHDPIDPVDSTNLVAASPPQPSASFYTFISSNDMPIELTASSTGAESSSNRIIETTDQFVVVSNLPLFPSQLLQHQSSAAAASHSSSSPPPSPSSFSFPFPDGQSAVDFIRRHSTPQAAINQLIQMRQAKKGRGDTQLAHDETLIMSIIYL